MQGTAQPQASEMNCAALCCIQWCAHLKMGGSGDMAAQGERQSVCGGKHHVIDGKHQWAFVVQPLNFTWRGSCNLMVSINWL